MPHGIEYAWETHKTMRGRAQKMNEEFERYLEKFDAETRQRFMRLHELVYESTSHIIEEKLWAKLPSFCARDRFIRIIPFNDHINIEAKAIQAHKASLDEYKITPKGMLQIQHAQSIPEDVLKKILQESLE